MAKQHLSGSVWYKYHKLDIKSWSAFKEKFEWRYQDRRTMVEKFVEMTNRKQKPGESAEDYFYCKIRLCKSLKVSFAESKELVLMGLRNGIVRSLLMIKHLDEESLLEDIETYERVAGGRQQIGLASAFGKESKVEVPKNRTTLLRNRSAASDTGRWDNRRTNVVCFKCNAAGHYSRECKQSEVKIKCFKCGDTGHIARSCRREK